MYNVITRIVKKLNESNNKVIVECSSNHEGFTIMVYFKEEVHRRCWDEGYCMFGATCKACNRYFFCKELKTIYEEPVYTFIN